MVGLTRLPHHRGLQGAGVRVFTTWRNCAIGPRLAVPGRPARCLEAAKSVQVTGLNASVAGRSFGIPAALVYRRLLPLGVTGNTPDSGSGESWFDPRRGNYKPGKHSYTVGGLSFSHFVKSREAALTAAPDIDSGRARHGASAHHHASALNDECAG